MANNDNSNVMDGVELVEGSNNEKQQVEIDANQTCSIPSTSKSIPLILDGKFFTVKKIVDCNVSAECTQCKRIIKGRTDAITNFRTHLKVKNHSIKEYENYRQNNYVHPKKRPSGSSDASQGNSDKKKLKQTSMYIHISRNEQQEADRLILDFVVQTMSPLAIVEHSAFINLIQGINTLKNPAKVITRKTLSKRIDDEYSRIMTSLKEKLKLVPYVCTTADIWSSSKRSYMGVTAHWINDKFQRESAALACRRFRGSHTYDKIAELIIELHSEFIDNSKTKIVKTVTDNGANMVKAFKSTKTNFSLNQLLLNENDDSFRNTLEVEYEDGTDDEDDEMNMVPISNVLVLPTTMDPENSENFPVSDFFLPEHQRCASHTLNLICTNDIKEAYRRNPNSMYSKIHNSAFAKCSALWNLTSRSPKASESYTKITGKAPTSPCPTRWNSTFDCLENLMKVKEKLNEVCEALDLLKLKETDVEFLLEYIEVVRPLAETLDKLQGSTHTFYGELIPQLMRMMKVIKSYQLRHLKYCTILATVLQESVKKRFEQYFSLSPSVNDAVLATITHPFFKLRWASKENKDKLKQLLLNEVEFASKTKSLSKNEQEKTIKSCENLDEKYFLFDESSGSSSDTPSTNNLQLQALQFLQNENVDFSILNQYPAIKELFVKYNTPLPSSAPVERLFSYAGMIMRPKRRCMTDDHLEKLLFLKANRLNQK